MANKSLPDPSAQRNFLEYASNCSLNGNEKILLTVKPAARKYKKKKIVYH